MLYHLSDYQRARPVELHHFFNERLIKLGALAKDKPSLEQRLAEFASESLGLQTKDVLQGLRAQETEGLSGIGHGVAIPHVRLAELESMQALMMIFEKPVDVNAVDRIPVDIVFLLLAPEKEDSVYLRALAKVSRLLRSEGLAEKLRGCKTPEAAFVLMTQAMAERAA